MAIFHANAPPETMAAALLEDYQELAQTLNHLARAFGDLIPTALTFDLQEPIRVSRLR
jgi:hypothetical protein